LNHCQQSKHRDESIAAISRSTPNFFSAMQALNVNGFAGAFVKFYDDAVDAGIVGGGFKSIWHATQKSLVLDFELVVANNPNCELSRLHHD
jgi:hypothetical protein